MAITSTSANRRRAVRPPSGNHPLPPLHAAPNPTTELPPNSAAAMSWPTPLAASAVFGRGRAAKQPQTASLHTKYALLSPTNTHRVHDGSAACKHAAGGSLLAGCPAPQQNPTAIGLGATRTNALVATAIQLVAQVAAASTADRLSP